LRPRAGSGRRTGPGVRGPRRTGAGRRHHRGAVIRAGRRPFRPRSRGRAHRREGDRRFPVAHGAPAVPVRAFFYCFRGGDRFLVVAVRVGRRGIRGNPLRCRHQLAAPSDAVVPDMYYLQIRSRTAAQKIQLLPFVFFFPNTSKTCLSTGKIPKKINIVLQGIIDKSTAALQLHFCF